MNVLDFDISKYLNDSNLTKYQKISETWAIQESSQKLGYFTHSFFRFFGKFPPPVASRFIDEYLKNNDELILDSMVGSGTTLVEATMRNLDAVGIDVNPLCTLISKVKTTYVDPDKINKYLANLVSFLDTKKNSFQKYIPEDKYLSHWFYKKNIDELAKIRLFLTTQPENEKITNLFKVGLASIIRNVSRASKGMGRMFLDPGLKAVDVPGKYSKKIKSFSDVMENWNYNKKQQKVITKDARNIPLKPNSVGLVICHPPYYNLYKYSSIFKFESLWLGLDYIKSKKQEVREGFKKGNLQEIDSYINDMKQILIEMHRILKRNRYCVLMIGDTFIKEKRLNTTSLLLKNLKQFDVEKFIVRIPKFTEASYSAAQRRTKKNVGVNIPDHIVVLKKK